MSREVAKRILARFDRAYPILCRGEDLPQLEKEIEETTKLEKFCDEMKMFLEANRLQRTLRCRPIGGPNFSTATPM